MMRSLVAIGAIACFLSPEVFADVAIVSDAPLFTKTSDLPLDSNGFLADHWLLFTDNNQCKENTRTAWTRASPELRKVASIDGDLKKALFGDSTTECESVVLERGAAGNLLAYPLPENLYKFKDIESYADWIRQKQRVEIGLISYEEHEANVYWIQPGSNKRVHVGDLGFGERNTIWQQTYLGHHFEVISKVSNEIYGRFTAEHHSFIPFGQRASMTRSMEVEDQVRSTFDGEWDRAHLIKRTFTEFGFNRRKLPQDLWCSLQAYYYNNRNHAVREEWETKGLFVNWWEVDPYMIVMPWELKRYWQRRLMTLVEEWTGVELELTDIYGMRRYEDGARLLTHVDRHLTHAASMIINVAQQEIREPWKVEIYDNGADRLHEVTMEPGDLVFYESARCLHGRMKPLQGAFYVNLFVHFRPKGRGDKWYKDPIPVNGTKPVLDIGVCQATGNSTSCSGQHQPPFLSPALETLHGGADLYRYWKQTGNVERRVAGQMVKPGAQEEAQAHKQHRPFGDLSSEL